MERTSVVQNIDVKSLSLSSTLIVGDCNVVKSQTNVLAVQRQLPVFFKNEGEFSDYPLFKREIPELVIHERLNMITENKSPMLIVRAVKVLSVSAASGMLVGASNAIVSEARTKHFRQFVENNQIP